MLTYLCNWFRDLFPTPPTITFVKCPKCSWGYTSNSEDEMVQELQTHYIEEHVRKNRDS